MSRTINIPRRAKLVDQFTRTIPEGPHAGQTVRFTRHRIPQGYADSGREILAFKIGSLNYRTDRGDRPEDESPTKGSWSYSGDRAGQAQQDWNHWKAEANWGTEACPDCGEMLEASSRALIAGDDPVCDPCWDRRVASRAASLIDNEVSRLEAIAEGN